MNSNPLSLISIFLSGIIAFSLMAFIVEMALMILNFSKFQLPRIKSFLRFLPFASLFADLISNTFSMSYLFNPLNCYSCIQKVALSLFFPDLKNYLYTNELSLIRYLGEKISHDAFGIVSLSIAIMTLILVLRKLAATLLGCKKLKKLSQTAALSHRLLQSQQLIQKLQEKKIQIFVHQKIDVPFAGSSQIFIPLSIEEQFPQEEFEAIVAHEMEHICWKDSTFRFFSQLISTIFWWVPTTKFIKKLELEQEIACDRNVAKYGIEESALASAIVKISKHSKEKTYDVFCYITENRHPIIIRLESILKTNTLKTSHLEKFSFVSVLLSSLLILLCALY